MAAKKLPDQRKSVTNKMLDHEEGLYRHKKRPEWGVAILAWEKDDRRAYQFQDGRLRKFKEGYYSLMEPVSEDEVERSEKAVVSSLEDAIEASQGEDPPQALEPVASFDEQMELFLEMYPEGFQDEKWLVDHRGDSGRALKRHREPIVTDLQDLMSQENSETLISSGKKLELAEGIIEILGNTSLVALKHVKTLRALEDDKKEAFADAVYNLIHGERDFDPKFDDYLDVLEEIYDGPVSWRIATAIPAIYFPQDHICVRRSAFMRQAAVIAPLARYSKRAQLRSYKNFRRVGFAVKQRLQAAGHEPRDLLDIYDFIWDTLRNAALDSLGDSDDD